MIRSLLLLISFIFLAGCLPKHPKELAFPYTGTLTEKPVNYAGGFTLRQAGKNTLVIIKNPWQNARKVEYSCLLSDTLRKSKIIDEGHCLIKTPVKRVVCLSTTHIGFIGFLNETPSIVGVSGKNYIVNEELQTRIHKDRLPDVGYDENLNYELILQLRPDVVLAYGVSSSVTSTVRKLNELGIPTMLIAEYLEEEPLAKMEWVKVFGELYGCEISAADKFDSVACNYQRLVRLAGQVKSKPKVLLGLPWRGTWFVSGGKSYVARLVADAGGKYIFENLNFKDSRPLALEKVFEQAMNTDFWLNSGDAGSIYDLLSVDSRFSNLSPVIHRQVYNNNNVLNETGGNGFFETGVVEPEIILSDLICILHPQLLPSHKLKYYRKLQ